MREVDWEFLSPRTMHESSCNDMRWSRTSGISSIGVRILQQKSQNRFHNLKKEWKSTSGLSLYS
jgi:hypothetical protein